MLPADVEQIAAVARLCHTHRVPLVVRGAGTGYTGGAVPVRGGVVLAMERLNRILEIDEDNLLAVVQPNVITDQLQDAVEARGLFYPPDPASLKISAIGGNVAECAGGPRAFKYGTTRRYVLALEAVLPTGEIIRTGSKAVKNVVGYDLTQLLIGSEGTLAIITEITLRLVPKPRAAATLQATFADITTAVAGVSALLAARVVPSTIEIVDSGSLAAVERYLGRADGPGRNRRDAAGRSGRRARRRRRRGGAGGGGVPRRRRPVGPPRGDARRSASGCGRRAVSCPTRCGASAPRKINHDVSVPRGRVPELFALLARLERDYRLWIPSFGHAGDGNIHVNLMVNPDDADEMARAKRRRSGALRRRRRARRLDQRRARHRLRQGALSVARARARRDRADAARQGGVRPARHPEPGEDVGDRTVWGFGP